MISARFVSLGLEYLTIQDSVALCKFDLDLHPKDASGRWASKDGGGGGGGEVTYKTSKEMVHALIAEGKLSGSKIVAEVSKHFEMNAWAKNHPHSYIAAQKKTLNKGKEAPKAEPKAPAPKPAPAAKAVTVTPAPATPIQSSHLSPEDIDSNKVTLEMILSDSLELQDQMDGLPKEIQDGLKAGLLDPMDHLVPDEIAGADDVDEQDYTAPDVESKDAPTPAPKVEASAGPVVFKDVQNDPAVAQKLEAAAQKSWDELTKAEQKILYGYTVNSTRLNAYVSGSYNKDADPKAKEGKDTEKQLEARAEKLDKAIEKSTIPEHVTVYRAMDARSLGSPENGVYKVKVGTTFKDPAYGSTSTHEGSARGFIRANRVLMKISVPQGAKGVYFGGSHRTKYPFEKELLLPRNTVYRVNEVTKGKTDLGKPITILHVQVLSK